MKTALLTTAFLAASALGFAAPASADSHQNKIKHFHGLYAGVQTGYAQFDISSDEPSLDLSPSGLTYSGFIGYRHQTDSGWIFGLEGMLGDQNGSSGDRSTSASFYKRTYGYLWQWNASAGFAFGSNDKNLVYSKFGVAGVQENRQIQQETLPSHNFQGLHVGIGYERSLSDRLNLRVEAGYSSLDSTLSQAYSQIGLLVKF